MYHHVLQIVENVAQLPSILTPEKGHLTKAQTKQNKNKKKKQKKKKSFFHHKIKKNNFELHHLLECLRTLQVFTSENVMLLL